MILQCSSCNNTIRFTQFLADGRATLHVLPGGGTAEALGWAKMAGMMRCPECAQEVREASVIIKSGATKESWAILQIMVRRWWDDLKALVGLLVALGLAVVLSVIWFFQDLRDEEEGWLE
jgi:hypothetical protein